MSKNLRKSKESRKLQKSRKDMSGWCSSGWRSKPNRDSS